MLINPANPFGALALALDLLFEPSPIEVALAYGSIETLDTNGPGVPVDVIAVGHYLHVRPEGAERDLDRAVSAALAAGKPVPDSGLLLTQFSDRGALRGDLGQIMFLPDPRDGTGKRLLAVAGMGPAGRFGAPELAVLARELCWSAGRLGRRHLATVLIGTTGDNIPVADAMAAWFRGIREGVAGSAPGAAGRLQRITFVVRDPTKVRDADEAIKIERLRTPAEREKMLSVTYKAVPDAVLRKADEDALQAITDAFRNRRPGRADGQENPTRLGLDMVQKAAGPPPVWAYRFSAITATAAVPEREVPLTVDLVMEANGALQALDDLDEQRELGRFMQEFLIPTDLRPHLMSRAPLVLLMDRRTAGIYWEMLAQPDLLGAGAADADDPDAEPAAAPAAAATAPAAPGAAAPVGAAAATAEFHEDDFFGTSRGLTRQLRTTFAPPPEPPPPPIRVLRVLVIADPAGNLPETRAEANRLVELFGAFNAAWQDRTRNRIQVTALVGPEGGANPLNVLRQLFSHSYNVVHYTGHCLYSPSEPLRSGWVFQGGRLLTINELNRIDRIPRFVFSNACETGIVQEESQLAVDQAQGGLEPAPAFADAFFNKGVSDFVCTAWKVPRGGPSTEFALRVYAGLLGLQRTPEGGWETFTPLPMHAAMREARVAVARTPEGRGTWGAYQHYGNPFFRLFDPATMTVRPPAPAEPEMPPAEEGPAAPAAEVTAPAAAAPAAEAAVPDADAVAPATDRAPEGAAPAEAKPEAAPVPAAEATPPVRRRGGGKKGAR